MVCTHMIVRLYVRSYARFNPLPFPGAFSLEIKKVGNHKTLFLAAPAPHRATSELAPRPGPRAARAPCASALFDNDNRHRLYHRSCAIPFYNPTHRHM